MHIVQTMHISIKIGQHIPILSSGHIQSDFKQIISFRIRVKVVFQSLIILFHFLLIKP